MACGADWGGYQGGYNNAYQDYNYGEEEWSYGDRAGYQQWSYENDISKDDLNGDILADQVAGYK